jgi:hypothetical protein
MNRLKTGLRIGGTALVAVGAMCLPLGFGLSPKRDQNLFSNIADLGAFVQTGVILMAIGLLAIGLSDAARGEMSD